MNREIKFRAWDEEEKEMLECVSVACTRENKWITMRFKNGYIDSIQNPHVLMQYTGIKDKNGKEVYEGDILSDETYSNVKGKVYFENGCFKVDLWNRDTLHDDMQEFELEIIGNIYDDPELLD